MTLYPQPADGIYPDIRYCVSGFFAPKDPSRCCVCGKALHYALSWMAPHVGLESTCGRGCFKRMVNLQRVTTREIVDRWIDVAERESEAAKCTKCT